jgi:hypothetical protein
MGLEIGKKMHLMDMDENTPISLFNKKYKHNISIHIWSIYSKGHKFGVYTILPKYHLYS